MTPPLDVVPTGNGEPEHIDGKDCWCEPELNYKDEFTGTEVWVHRERQ